MAHILIVDDDERICKVFDEFLSGEGHQPIIASNADEALASIRAKRPDLVLMDIRMPGLSGLDALARIRQIDADVYVVIMTAYGTSQTSIEAMRLGAYDYLIKPLDLHDVKKVINSALEAQELSREIKEDTSEDREMASMVNLVGSTAEMQEAYKLIGMLATNTVPALLIGERGVGKHLVAQTIHANSDRREGPFVAVHCNSLRAEDLEVEIFGQGGSGPSSDKVTRTSGQLAAAAGGTLFLDDIEALPLNLQHRLLRVLVSQNLGQRAMPGEMLNKVTTRVITATEVESGLGERVRENSFNQELFQHLRTLSIRLPPLRMRLDDLPELVMHFIHRCNNELDKSLRGVDERVMERLRAYSWPGNVGELESVIKRAAVLARSDVITLAEIGGQLEDSSFVKPEDAAVALELAVRRCLRHSLSTQQDGDSSNPFHDIVRRVETILVNEAVAEASGSQVRAAALLGLNRTTLRAKLGR